MDKGKNVYSLTNLVAGIADFPEQDNQSANAIAWCRSVDYRTNPNQITLLPATVKESGNVITDLPKWGDIIPTTSTLYYYGDSGNLYKRTSAGSHSFLRQVANSHGNGLGYFREDDFLYYTSDKLVGRYGPISSSSPTFADDFFGSQGGIPLNTNSLDLESSSSQYADRADSATESITGDIAFDIQIKPESLPTVGNTMTLASKWNLNGNLRSYLFDISAVSGYFGDGTDGALTISADTTEAPIDSACTGTSGGSTLTATNVSFATGQVILIHQSQGTGAGTWMRNTINGYTAGTITLGTPLNSDYTSGAQVRVLKQYSSITVNSGKTWTVKSWNGTVGGILCNLCQGTATITGSISANGGVGQVAIGAGSAPGGIVGGFRGGAGVSTTGTALGFTGEGNAGVALAQPQSNGNGGGGGVSVQPTTGASGGSGGNATAGTIGNGAASASGGEPGNSAGTTDLTTMVFGGGGGGGANDGQPGQQVGGGGSGGGIIFLIATTLTVTGTITATGGNGGAALGGADTCAGAGGAGGSILLKAQVATLGSGLITASGGFGGTALITGPTGSVGRIHLDYYTSYTGTTTPTLDVTQDNTLVTNTTYQLRLSVSTNGTNSETLAQAFSPQLSTWQQVGVSWDASASTAEFFLNAVSLGTRTGAFTSINDNASRFAVGANFNGAGSAANFYDGLIDEVRVFNTTRSAADMQFGLQMQIPTNIAGLVAYYKFNGDYLDATANTNNLTAHNTPVFVTDVPYPSPSTRLDIDQMPNPQPSGDTYALTTAISEAAVDRLTFEPALDPQKSIAVDIAAIGTGNWTITVHDQYNDVVATKTVTNALLNTGWFEFTFSSVWRPIVGNAYHFHLTSTIADGTVITSANNNLETAAYITYYQFLVEDDFSHAIANMINFKVFLNERYLATWDSLVYQPNRIVFSSGWRSRCYAYWHEFLAVGCIRGDTITGTEQGRIYFWDGISDTFNFYIDVPEGGVNAMLGSKGNLYIDAGYLADLMAYQGGDAAVKLKRIPKIQTADTVAIYPGAMTMWRALLHYGVAGESNSSTVEKGVYSWGSLNKSYSDSLSYDYPISTGNRTSSVSIGLVIPVETKLLIGWKDNVSFGMDVVDPAGDPFSNGTVESLIQRDGHIWKDQMALKLRGDFLPLASGESVDIKYKLDRATNWTPLSSPFSLSSTANQNTPSYGVVETEINPGRNREYQIAYDLYTTGSTSPTMLGESLYEDLLINENQF